MKQTFFAVTLVCVTPVLSQSTQFAKEYLPIWESSKNITIELAEAMPDSLYDFRPTQEMRSFKQQMLHIGHTITWMYQYIIDEKRKNLPEQPKASELNKGEVIDYLKKQFDDGASLLMDLKEEDLTRKVNYFDSGVIPLQYGFISIQDHLVNHRSKANLYFRLNGLKPPEYTYLRLK